MKNRPVAKMRRTKWSVEAGFSTERFQTEVIRGILDAPHWRRMGQALLFHLPRNSRFFDETATLPAIPDAYVAVRASNPRCAAVDPRSPGPHAFGDGNLLGVRRPLASRFAVRRGESAHRFEASTRRHAASLATGGEARQPPHPPAHRRLDRHT
jgi:hypothetical protein